MNNKLLIYYYTIILFSLIFISCGEKKKTEECKRGYVQASNMVNNYYQDENIFHLDTALNVLDKIYNECPYIRKELIPLQVTVYSLLGKYKEGGDFVTSTEITNYNKRYKRDLYINGFKMLSAKDRCDSVAMIYYCEKSIKNISQYLLDNHEDTEAIYDLCFIKSQYMAEDKFLLDIDSLQKTFSLGLDYVNGLKGLYKAPPASADL